jgi:hypothetical protein
MKRRRKIALAIIIPVIAVMIVTPMAYDGYFNTLFETHFSVKDGFGNITISGDFKNFTAFNSNKDEGYVNSSAVISEKDGQTSFLNLSQDNLIYLGHSDDLYFLAGSLVTGNFSSNLKPKKMVISMSVSYKGKPYSGFTDGSSFINASTNTTTIGPTDLYSLYFINESGKIPVYNFSGTISWSFSIYSPNNSDYRNITIGCTITVYGLYHLVTDTNYVHLNDTAGGKS